MFSKSITNYIEQGWWHTCSSFSLECMLAAQGHEQKRKACLIFTQINLFSKWNCIGNTLPHNLNLWTSYVILVQCNVFMIFWKYCYYVPYHNKFTRFLHYKIDLRATFTWDYILISSGISLLVKLKCTKSALQETMCNSRCGWNLPKSIKYLSYFKK